MSRTVDHVGPLTSTVTDACRTMLHALRGEASLTPVTGTPLATADAVPRRYFCERLDDDVRRAFEAAVGHAAAAGRDARRRGHCRRRAHCTGLRACVFGDAAAYHADTLETMPEKYHAERAHAARDGALRPRGRLCARARRPPPAQAPGRHGSSRTSRPVCRHCQSWPRRSGRRRYRWAHARNRCAT